MKQLLLLAFLFTASTVSAQEKGTVVISGSTTENLKAKAGFTMTLFADAANNGSLAQRGQMVTNISGKFAFDLDHNAIYVLKCSKKGYATKKIRFDTAMQGVKADSTLRFEFKIDMVPSKEDAPENPMVQVYYNAALKKFDYKLK